MIVDHGEFFARDELECKCGCGRARMDARFVELLDNLRDNFGGPIVLSSAYRCPEYNAQVSSTGTNGPHTTGKAVDILASGEDAFRILDHAFALGDFKGIGIAQKGEHGSRFIHLDTLEKGTRPWVWSY